MENGKILVTGATGQIGSELVPELRKRHGIESVVVGGHRRPPSAELASGPFEVLEVTKRETVESVIKKHDIGTIYHLAAILSANGEKDPLTAWNVNMNGAHNIMELAREYGIRVFHPSSIAAFGPETPRDMTPQDTVLRPRTMYGVTKVAGELLGNYYADKFGVDIRGLRYPGIISSKTPPGGGTTDYAVEIFYEAVKNRRYSCFLREGSTLPMMYMPDCIKATLSLMDASASRLRHRTDFNVAAFSFSPAELALEIKKHIPEFTMEYDVDPVRQAIADSWPKTIDDSAARSEWGWKPDYGLPGMAEDMVSVLGQRLMK